MRRVAAIVTEKGGRTAHAAIVSREFGLPCIVGADGATTALHTGDAVTVCCAEGEEGHVYAGEIAFAVDKVDAASIPATRTPILLNVGDPAPGVHAGSDSEQRRGPGAHRIHHQQRHRHSPDGAGAVSAAERSGRGQGDRRAPQRRGPARLLRAALQRRRRPDRGGVLPEAGDRADQRLQDQRIRLAARWRRIRAGRGESDARLPRRVAVLRPRGTPTDSRSNVPACCARGAISGSPTSR